MKVYMALIAATLLMMNGIETAYAVPPPDFLFAVGSQLGVIFSVLVVVLSGALGVATTLAKSFIARIRHRKAFWAFAALAVICLSLSGGYAIDRYRQQSLYMQWVRESNRQSGSGAIYASSSKTETRKSEDDASFFEAHRDLPIAISNEEFQSAANQGPPFVLDAREDEEYAIGNFPESLHIRFADLLSGAWTELPNDRVVYVFCWSGIRGKETTDFLRSKHIAARYIENGANGWVTFGGAWNGGIHFLDTYTGERYQIVFTIDQVREYEKQGVVFVDSRPQSKFEKWHIPGSISIPIIYTPTARMEDALAQVPPHSKVITVCDDFVSCFDAKVAGVKLEKRGNAFLGRYNKPWEYRSTQ